MEALDLSYVNMRSINRELYYEGAKERGHNPHTCPCGPCGNWRGEKNGWKKTYPLRARGYLCLTDPDDARFTRIVLLDGRSKSEICREAIREYIRRREAELGIDPGK